MSLEITKSRAEQLGKLEDKAISKLLKQLEAGGDMDDTAKMAIKALNTVRHNRRDLLTKSNLGFNMTKFVGTAEQLKKYIMSTQPEIKKVIGGK
ncbi:MAG: hypothetical protein GY941_21470 [Planctomycetes bacterium]|nr:hypothetical protein [Planctomycetota bacterium]